MGGQPREMMRVGEKAREYRVEGRARGGGGSKGEGGRRRRKKKEREGERGRKRREGGRGRERETDRTTGKNFSPRQHYSTREDCAIEHSTDGSATMATSTAGS